MWGRTYGVPIGGVYMAVGVDLCLYMGVHVDVYGCEGVYRGAYRGGGVSIWGVSI